MPSDLPHSADSERVINRLHCVSCHGPMEGDPADGRWKVGGSMTCPVTGLLHMWDGR
jgi:mono/diheme cytochrome c family protein